MAIFLLIALVLANFIMLVKITSLIREFRAGMLRCQNAVPEASALVRMDIARVDGKVERLLEGDVRMEAASVVVADNLAESQQRADETIGAEGAAADAASRTGDA